jgi:hypothetical protein
MRENDRNIYGSNSQQRDNMSNKPKPVASHDALEEGFKN